MPEGMKKEIGVVAYALADSMEISTSDEVPRNCSIDHREDSCAIVPRLQRWLMRLSTDVYHHSADSAYAVGVDNFDKVAIAVVVACVIVGISGILLVYGAVAKNPNYFCMWQVATIVLDLFCAVSACLVLYMVFDGGLSLHDFWQGDVKQEVGRFFKLMVASVTVLTSEMVLACSLAERLMKDTAKKFVLEGTTKAGGN